MAAVICERMLPTWQFSQLERETSPVSIATSRRSTRRPHPGGTRRTLCELTVYRQWQHPWLRNSCQGSFEWTDDSPPDGLSRMPPGHVRRAHSRCDVAVDDENRRSLLQRTARWQHQFQMTRPSPWSGRSSGLRGRPNQRRSPLEERVKKWFESLFRRRISAQNKNWPPS